MIAVEVLKARVELYRRRQIEMAGAIAELEELIRMSQAASAQTESAVEAS